MRYGKGDANGMEVVFVVVGRKRGEEVECVVVVVVEMVGAKVRDFARAWESSPENWLETTNVTWKDLGYETGNVRSWMLAARCRRCSLSRPVTLAYFSRGIHIVFWVGVVVENWRRQWEEVDVVAVVGARDLSRASDGAGGAISWDWMWS